MIITPALVIFNCILFILIFLFVKTIDKRKWLSVIVSVILTPLVYFYIFYPILNIFSSYHHQKYFNAEAWVEAPSFRFEMVRNIMRSDTLIGQSKEAIKHQLGNYEWLGWNEQMKDHDPNDWNYGLGMLPGAFNNKKECMSLMFENEKVIAVKTYNEEITFEDEN